MKKIILSIFAVVACVNVSAQIVKVTDANGQVHEFENPQSVLFCPSESTQPVEGGKMKAFTITRDMTKKKLGYVPTVYSLTWDGDLLSQLVDDEDESITYTKTSTGVKFAGSLTSDGTENMEYDLVLNGSKADYFTWTNRDRKYVFQYDGSKFTGILRERNGAINPEYGYPKFTFDSNGRITQLDNGTGHDVIDFKYEGSDKQTNDVVNVPMTIAFALQNIDNAWAPFSAMLMGTLGSVSGDLPSSATMVRVNDQDKEETTQLTFSYTIGSDGRVQKIGISGATYLTAPTAVEFEY